MELAAINLDRRLLNASNDCQCQCHDNQNDHAYIDIVFVAIIVSMVFAWCSFMVVMAVKAYFHYSRGSPPPPTTEIEIEAYWFDSKCRFCLGNFVDGEMIEVVGDCGHCFHAGCMDSWRFWHHDSCPTCRYSRLHPTHDPP